MSSHDNENPLLIAPLDQKILAVDTACQLLLSGKKEMSVPQFPKRNVLVVEMNQLPKKKGLSLEEGRGHLLHDLANIELQAVELGLRTLMEFPDAPSEFRQQLVDIVREETKHLKMCIDNLSDLGFQWGDWPVHLSLWRATSQEDDLLDRILIVHRYLEGSGLEAGDSILQRLSGVPQKSMRQTVRTIVEDELGHVEFGSRWYKEICEKNKINSDLDFELRMSRLKHLLPKRLERINPNLRKKVGFSNNEIKCLEKLRQSWFQKASSSPKSLH